MVHLAVVHQDLPLVLEDHLADLAAHRVLGGAGAGGLEADHGGTGRGGSPLVVGQVYEPGLLLVGGGAGPVGAVHLPDAPAAVLGHVQAVGTLPTVSPAAGADATRPRAAGAAWSDDSAGSSSRADDSSSCVEARSSFRVDDIRVEDSALPLYTALLLEPPAPVPDHVKTVAAPPAVGDSLAAGAHTARSTPAAAEGAAPEWTAAAAGDGLDTIGRGTAGGEEVPGAVEADDAGTAGGVTGGAVGLDNIPSVGGLGRCRGLAGWLAAAGWGGTAERKGSVGVEDALAGKALVGLEAVVGSAWTWGDNGLDWGRLETWELGWYLETWGTCSCLANNWSGSIVITVIGVFGCLHLADFLLFNIFSLNFWFNLEVKLLDDKLVKCLHLSVCHFDGFLLKQLCSEDIRALSLSGSLLCQDWLCAGVYKFN